MENVTITFGLVPLFNGISTFMGYLNAKAIFVEEKWLHYSTQKWVGGEWGSSYLSLRY